MYQEKRKRIRLHGKKLKELNDAVYRRDDGNCVLCGAYVEEGTKFHHEPCGVYKSDEIEKAVLLCPACHYARHHTSQAGKIRDICCLYLKRLYGDKGAKKE